MREQWNKLKCKKISLSRKRESEEEHTKGSLCVKISNATKMLFIALKRRRQDKFMHWGDGKERERMTPLTRACTRMLEGVEEKGGDGEGKWR